MSHFFELSIHRKEKHAPPTDIYTSEHKYTVLLYHKRYYCLEYYVQKDILVQVGRFSLTACLKKYVFPFSKNTIVYLKHNRVLKVTCSPAAMTRSAAGKVILQTGLSNELLPSAFNPKMSVTIVSCKLSRCSEFKCPCDQVNRLYITDTERN